MLEAILGEATAESRLAYEFNATSYTFSAMTACIAAERALHFQVCSKRTRCLNTRGSEMSSFLCTNGGSRRELQSVTQNWTKVQKWIANEPPR
jgi:hypothetical protein